MLNYQFIVPVWGDDYIKTFLKLSLPSQLAPYNLGGFKKSKNISYYLYTSPQDIEKFKVSSSFRYLSGIINTHLIPVHEINFNINRHYDSFSACYKLGIKDASRNHAAAIFLTADQIWADGSFSNIINMAEQGKRAIMLSGPRVVQETFVPDFLDRFGNKNPLYISLSSRDAVRMALKHLHAWDQSLFWGADNKGRPASFLYWKVGEEGFLMHCFHLHPVLLNPAGGYPEFNYTIDGSDFVSKATPDLKDIAIVDDSDVVMYFSIAPAKQSAEWINIPQSDWRCLLKWAKVMGLNRHNLYYLQKKIRFHMGTMSGEWEQIEIQSDTPTMII